MESVSQFFNGIATNLNGFTNNISGQLNINISLDSTSHQKMTSVKRGHESVVLPVYTGSDDISGQIEVELTETTQYNHLGLKCFLIGQLEIYKQPQLSTQFTLLCKELEPAGHFLGNKIFKFKFSHFDKEYETFKGKAGQVKYFIRVSLARNLMPPIQEQQEFAVFIPEDQTHLQLTPMLLNVGVDNRLHIEFLLHKNYYHIKQWVEGTVKFAKVRIPLSRMQISLIRKQSLGTPDSTISDCKTLETFEVMDGCPEEGEFITFRMCMKGVKNLTPSYRSVHNRLFVRHQFQVTLYDHQNKKYSKKTQINFYRK